MSKVIKIIENDKVAFVEVTNEEMLQMFDRMIEKFAYKCVNGLNGYLNDIEDYQDFKQLASIKAVRVLERYDLSRGACFSKALFEGFKNMYIDLIKEREAKKRKCEKPFVYINSHFKSGDEISKTISNGQNDVYFKNESNELEEFLTKNLTKEEIIYYSMGLKKKVVKADVVQKVCLEHTIEIFENHVGIIPNKKEELAKILGLSRPTLNKRIKEASEKVVKLTTDYCLRSKIVLEL